MKKIMGVSLMALSIMIATSVFAADKPAEKAEIKTKPVVTKSTKKEVIKKVDAHINLYESPKINSKIIKELPLFSNLVAIYQKGDWLKVGDRKDGSTGWINLSQYNAAKNDYYRSAFQVNTQSVYLRSEKNDKGKVEVVAYQNGKKLTSLEAKKLYDHMQAQEKKQWDAMQKINDTMNQEMQNIFQMPLMMPGVVIINNQ